MKNPALHRSHGASIVASFPRSKNSVIFSEKPLFGAKEEEDSKPRARSGYEVSDYKIADYETQDYKIPEYKSVYDD